MLKAGALVYAVFISFLLAVISGLLISISLINNKNYYYILEQGKLIDNINSAINIALYTPNLLDYNKNITIDLFDDSNDIVEISKKSWGAFEIIEAKSQWLNFHEKKIALVGIDYHDEENIALYLADNNNYLYISGNTRLNGECFIPGSQIKTTSVEGREFVGKKPNNEELFESQKTLPDLNKKIKDILLNNLGNGNQIGDSLFNYNDLINSNNTLTNSFYNKTLVLYSDENIIINNKKISGNIIIKSEKTVEIDNNARIDNIIVYAPEIIIKSGFEGTLQVFAKYKILIENNCKLNYPSLICTINGQSEIIINEGSIINGAVFLFLNQKENHEQSGIIINDHVKINGQVYSNGYIQHKGVLYGNMYCENFILKTSSSSYENHLIDAVINSDKLSDYYIGSTLLFENSNRKIISWLY